MTATEDNGLFSFDPSRLPGCSRPEHAARTIERWLANASEGDSAFIRQLASDATGKALVEAVAGNSPFLAQCLQRDAAFSCRLLRQGPELAFDELLADCEATLGAETDQSRLMAGLRRARRHASLTVAVADIAEVWTVEQVMQSLSAFADVTISLAVRQALRSLAASGRIVLPYPEEPERDSGYVVLGLGKLGARELNYSSDVDLIVLYDPDKVEADDIDSIGRHMVRATRDVVRTLEERTAEGYVHRADLRLRPDPGTTPVAISTLAAETYYESVGQNWERMAMIRARPVAGDLELGESFLHHLRPFIWRKNLDFAAIEDIHSVKRQITAHRGGRQIAVNGHNIKLGRGGIREIEFYAQTQQLIWGGRNPDLRGQQVEEVLQALAENGRITAEAASDLTAAYRFLRRIEHRLQMVDDKQTHELPRTDEKVEEIAIFAGFATADDFRNALLGQLRLVERHYAELFEESPDLGNQGSLVFTGNELHPDTLETLREMGYGDPSKVFNVVRVWHHGRYPATRSERSRQLLTELMPRLLAALAGTANPDVAFSRFNEFLGRLPAGVQLLSLLYANPGLLDLVAMVMGDAPLLADWLSRNPHLLDYVLAEDFDRPIEDFDSLADSLTEALSQADHFEHVLDITRRWTNDHKFQVGIQVLRGVTDGIAAGPVLTAVAETVIRALWRHVEREFAEQHGQVEGGGMCAIAYGKLGGRELMPGSDLDLVFVYDHAPEAESSDGRRPLAPSVYYLRLAQRMVSAITAPTGEGRLYEIDLRLRPSGNKGPVATQLDGFLKYQQQSAWTWEHMALTRARPISGPDWLCVRLREEIHSILTQPRSSDALVQDVAKMRARMAAEHRGRSPWDVKHRRGGLVDIEFIAQYLQLLNASAAPSVLSPTTATALDALTSAGMLDAEVTRDLEQALRLWQGLQSVIRLIGPERLDDGEPPAGQRNALLRGTGTRGLDELRDKIDTTAEAIHRHFTRLIDDPAASRQELTEAR